MTRIVLVRHGETEWNRSERFRGRADIPLNETGLSQARATASQVALRWRSSMVYSSPLSRAVATADIIAGTLGARVQVHPGLTDIDYGQWQGRSQDEVRQQWPGLLEAWLQRPHTVRVPGGESLDDVRARCKETLEGTVARHPGSTIVLVAHTVVNRVLLLLVLGLDNERFWRLRQDTCAINEVEADAGDFTLVSMNETCHLRQS